MPVNTVGEMPDASAPFVNDEADIILRSSDGVDFHTFKLLLSLASPFFRSTFSLPQPGQAEGPEGTKAGGSGAEMKNGVSVVQLTEHSEVVKNMLIFCYPMCHPTMETLQEVQDLWEAASKYEIEELMKWLGSQFVEKRFLEDEPVRAYAIACRYRLDPLAKAAAIWTLRYPRADLDIHADHHELEAITAGAFVRLMKFHRRCSEVVSALVNHTQSPGLSWISTFQYNFFTCTSCHHHRSKVRFGLSQSVAKWFLQYLVHVGEVLQIRPCKSVIMEDEVTGKALNIARESCSRCGPAAQMDLKLFSEVFGEEIDRVISEVSKGFWFLVDQSSTGNPQVSL
ncbi:hypothetical protein JAAARDRAFT_171723 [Jaapia argillacea MUCL 33604]|uniref:BTB domain-containing protein n=1 Tax=Jaapia argillacea MUCL 33604 TaxID=933084 RepID=A0A067Q5S1_9AGAM|nr:hypothetical protein JAAARDRAFT_171723 [Jaapia argillacea MUCL 33604]